MKNVKASVAEYERLKITERMVRGRRQKAAAGNVVMHGHVPFGYRQEERDGKTMLRIHEPEAQVVRLMFQWHVNGSNSKGPMSIRGVTHTSIVRLTVSELSRTMSGPAVGVSVRSTHRDSEAGRTVMICL